MKTYLRLILGKIVSAFCERWDLVFENVVLRHQIGVLERSGRQPQFTNTDRLVWVVLSTVWHRWPEALEIVNVDTVKRLRRPGFRHYLLGKSRRRRPGRPATSGRRIKDEPVSCQSIYRFRHQTVITPVDFADRGPPVVKPLFNDSSLPGKSVAVVCPTPIGCTDTCGFRWRKVTQTIHPHHFSDQSDRLAA